MIAQLTGPLVEKDADRVVVDIHGVGYEVSIPFSTYYELGELGDAVTLRIHTHVKEDALSLYGFSAVKEKQLFTRLIQVSGIGPKLGITILSGLPAEELIQAVLGADVVRLNGIPGVGKKTAERIILEMRDKVAGLASAEEEAVAGGASGSLQRDVVSALVNLGYSKPVAEKAVSQVLNEDPTDRFETLLRRTLRKTST